MLRPDTLDHAASANLHAFFLALGGAPPALAPAGLSFWHTQVPYPWFSGVLAARPPQPGDERAMREGVGWFREQGARTITWWLAAGVARAGWAALLHAHGATWHAGPPGMSMALEDLPRSPGPPGLAIRSVRDEAALRLWAQTFLDGFELPHEWEAGFAELVARPGLDGPSRLYLGLLDGEPVATSHCFLGAGVAGIQFVATRRAARGRGIGAAMTVAPLAEARQRGYRTGILQSSDQGLSLYQRLGFRQGARVGYFTLEVGRG